LRKSSDIAAADTMLANWSSKSPSLRTAIIDELLKRERWTEQLHCPMCYRAGRAALSLIRRASSAWYWGDSKC
jgi:hypothetical protein